MAERRMFAKSIIDSDAFIDMPITARLLYYDLGMRADDDGFVNSPKKIMRMIGASEDDMRILIARKFIIPFDTGVVVIKHWRIHNYIQSDRRKETTYQKELAMLEVEDNKSYRLITNDNNQPCIQNGYNMDTQDRLGEVRLVEDRLEPYFPFPEVEDAFQEFLKIRKKLKAVNSERAINSLVAKINEYSDGDASKAVEVITQSIENSWKGIFPLKGQKQSPKQTQTNYFFSQTGV